MGLFGNCRDNGQVEAVLPQFVEERPHQEAACKSAHSFSTAIPKEPEFLQQINTELQRVPTSYQAEADALASFARQLVETATADHPNKQIVVLTAVSTQQAAKQLALAFPIVQVIVDQMVAQANHLV